MIWQKPTFFSSSPPPLPPTAAKRPHLTIAVFFPVVNRKTARQSRTPLEIFPPKDGALGSHPEGNPSINGRVDRVHNPGFRIGLIHIIMARGAAQRQIGFGVGER